MGGKKEQSLEVWDGGSLVASANAHGDVHGDVYSGAVPNPANRKLKTDNWKPKKRNHKP